ncbi:MAG: hypothetical protein ACR2LR_04780, partial [Hassallia sp.]
MHQPSEQLALFTFELPQVDSLTTPRPWSKTYRSWRGEFEVIRDRKVGKSKARYFDFSIEIYDPEGSLETVVEITSPLTTDAEAEFRYSVDKLVDGILSIQCLPVSESNLFIDSLTFTQVSNDTNDSLTFEDSSVTESLVSDVTRKNDSLTPINIYKAKGTARGDRKYFRYSYKEGGKTRHLHIGGAIGAAGNFAVRVVSGQDPGAAAAGALGQFSGGLVGGAIGS